MGWQALRPCSRMFAETGLRQMIQIMGWVVWSQRLKALQEADSISISVDDRADFRVVRYRCSYSSRDAFQAAVAPAVPAVQSLRSSSKLEEWCEMEPLVVEGILGVMRTSGNLPTNTFDSHNADKSEKMAESIVEALRLACQDIDGQLNDDTLGKICSRVRHYASDQGTSAHKAGELLSCRAELPNLLWISCDMAHQVRIAAKDPLHANEEFEKQWERLFNKRHALIPDIQNSEVWKSRLIAAQKAVLASNSPSCPSCPLDKVLHTFSFAKQRFDSTATPMMKYCCLLRAIALLCAMQAADEPQRFERLQFSHATNVWPCSSFWVCQLRKMRFCQHCVHVSGPWLTRSSGSSRGCVAEYDPTKPVPVWSYL